VTVDGRDAVPVRWRVSRSSDLGDAVAEGQATAAGEDDFTVKVDVRNLEGRDRPAEDGERPVATTESRDRSLLREDQRRWLRDELRAPAAARVSGNQVMMAPLRVLTFRGRSGASSRASIVPKPSATTGARSASPPAPPATVSPACPLSGSLEHGLGG
jgi:phosphodiesterase/alkaline phosphatase D-like protein